MKRNCKKNNLNTNLNNSNHMKDVSRTNLVTPEILVNQVWMQEENTCGVKIIELNSSSGSSKETPVKSNHAWSYVNNDNIENAEALEYGNNYVVNEAARRRRRINKNSKENNYATACTNEYYCDRGLQSNSNTLYDYDTYESDINKSMKHQTNHYFISGCSTENRRYDNYDGIEIIEVDDSEEKKYWEHVYNEEVVTYDPEAQTEKRTVWIYSYKNKRLLSDNDCELVNISSKNNSDTSTSGSTSDEDQIVETTYTRRIGSPIPATFVPRLDLSLVQTLSTVTEISESKNSSNEIINIKPRNNWFSERNKVNKHVENSSVINWMALSPRERRRRSINTTLDCSGEENVGTTEITYAEGSTQLDRVSIKSSRVESSTVHVQVDIHTNEKETFKEVLTAVKTEAIDESEVDITQTHLIDTISLADSNDEDCNEAAVIDISKKPSIKLHTKPIRTIITNPIENLYSNTWIEEEQIEKETNVHDLEDKKIADVLPKSENVKLKNASQRLWTKSLQLMKPPEWTEYLPATYSPPCLNISISINSFNEKRTWFKRFKKYINCCK